MIKLKHFTDAGYDVPDRTPAHYLELDNLEVWFSYETPIAYRVYPGERVIRKNDWGPTTGRHLNALDPDKTKRIPGPQFMAQFNKVCQTVRNAQPS